MKCLEHWSLLSFGRRWRNRRKLLVDDLNYDAFRTNIGVFFFSFLLFFVFSCFWRTSISVLEYLAEGREKLRVGVLGIVSSISDVRNEQ